MPKTRWSLGLLLVGGGIKSKAQVWHVKVNSVDFQEQGQESCQYFVGFPFSKSAIKFTKEKTWSKVKNLIRCPNNRWNMECFFCF